MYGQLYDEFENTRKRILPSNVPKCEFAVGACQRPGMVWKLKAGPVRKGGGGEKTPRPIELHHLNTLL